MGRWVVEDIDGRMLTRVDLSGGAQWVALAIIGGLCAGLAGMMLALMGAIRIARVSPGMGVIMACMGFLVGVIPTASKLLGRQQRRVAVWDAGNARYPEILIEQDRQITTSELSFTVLDDARVMIARLVGARLEGADGAPLASAAHTPETPLDAGLVARLGLAAPRLDTECLSINDSRGTSLGELRRDAELLGGALFTGAGSTLDPRLLFAFVVGLELLLPRKPKRFP